MVPEKRKDALVAKVCSGIQGRSQLTRQAFEKSSKGESKKDKKQARLEDLKELLGVA